MAKSLHPEDQQVLMELLYRHEVLRENVTDIVNPKSKQGLPISRSKAHALLRYAEDHQLIEKSVLMLPSPQEELGFRVRAACRHFGVRNVLVLPGIADDTEERWDMPEYRAFLRRSLGALAAKYVQSIDLEPGDHIGVGGGRTLRAFSLRFSPTMRDLVFRPLAIGGRWRVIKHVDSAATVQALVSRLGSDAGGGATALCPEHAPGVDGKMAMKRPEVRAVFGAEAKRPRVAITSLGRRRYVPTDDPDGWGPHRNTSSLVQVVALAEVYRAVEQKLRGKRAWSADDIGLFYGRLKDEVYAAAAAELRTKEIVGDLCRHGLTAAGKVVETRLQRTSLAITPDQLHAWRKAGTETIVVVGGSKLAPVLHAALRTEAFQTLVIDSALALQLLDPKNRPEPYQHIPVVEDVED